MWLAIAPIAAESPNDYDDLQALYVRYRALGVRQDRLVCPTVLEIVAGLEKYTGHLSLVPADRQRTVLFPSPKDEPTIGDLASDRILRIKKAMKQCFFG